MKKLSKINEGMWKSGVNRSKSGEERLEDKLNTNIKTLKTVDMGSNAGVDVLFADKDLEINGRTSFTYDEMKSYIPYIEKQGWRVPTYDEMHSFFMNCLITINGRKFRINDVIRLEKFDDEVFFEIESVETGNSLYFPLRKSKIATYNYDLEWYWLLKSDEEYKDRYGIITIAPERITTFSITTSFRDSVTKLRIRLVKDR